MSVPGATDAGQQHGKDDAGSSSVGDFDAALPIEVDAGTPAPGDPPPELADQACAVDTNKLYELVTQARPPAPTQLAVDVVGSRFALAYVGESASSIDAIYMAELEGASGVGEPRITLALDPGSKIEHASIAYNGKHWLIGSVDARMDSPDLWVQAFDGKQKFTPYRVTNTLRSSARSRCSPRAAAACSRPGRSRWLRAVR